MGGKIKTSSKIHQNANNMTTPEAEDPERFRKENALDQLLPWGPIETAEI